MPRTIDPPDMPRLDVLDDEFGEDTAALARARRRRTGARLSMLVALILGLGAIGALAFAWSNADGRLRFDLQTAATAPKSAQRTSAEEEVERLRGQIEALKEDVVQLTEAQRQAAHTIAASRHDFICENNAAGLVRAAGRGQRSKQAAEPATVRRLRTRAVDARRQRSIMGRSRSGLMLVSELRLP